MTASLGCFHSGYENVRLEVNGSMLFFHPDRGAPREPMPLNITTRFAGNAGRWGILFIVPYRETGLGAINRTIFTSVLYLTAVDGSLRALVGKPEVLYKNEGHIRVDIARTPKGIGVAYLARDGRLMCREYDIRQGLALMKSYTVPGGDSIVMTDGSMADMALSYYNGSLYGLARKKGLSIVKAGPDGRADEFPVVPGPSMKGTVQSGDIHADGSGIHVLWAEASGPYGNAERAFFYHAFFPPGSRQCAVTELKVHGDSANTLKVSFGEKASGLTVLLQRGNTLWTADISRTDNRLVGMRKLISTGTGKYPSPAMYGCTAGDCYVFFQKIHGPWMYSEKTGLRDGGPVQYRRAVGCKEGECIQETSNMGISVMKGL